MFLETQLHKTQTTNVWECLPSSFSEMTPFAGAPYLFFSNEANSGGLMRIFPSFQALNGSDPQSFVLSGSNNKQIYFPCEVYFSHRSQTSNFRRSGLDTLLNCDFEIHLSVPNL
jgi:hypothetical protein